MTERRARYGSSLERTLETHLRAHGIEGWQREYKFHEKRRWRFDFAWPELRLAVECEGGTWSRGRHTRGSGFAADCEKYNAASLAGWRVLRYTSEMVSSGQAAQEIAEAVAC